MLLKVLHHPRILGAHGAQMGWLVAIFAGMLLLLIALTARLVEVTWVSTPAS